MCTIQSMLIQNCLCSVYQKDDSMYRYIKPEVLFSDAVKRNLCPRMLRIMQTVLLWKPKSTTAKVCVKVVITVWYKLVFFEKKRCSD